MNSYFELLAKALPGFNLGLCCANVRTSRKFEQQICPEILATGGARPGPRTESHQMSSTGAGRIYGAAQSSETISFLESANGTFNSISLALNDTQITKPLFAAQLQHSPNSLSLARHHDFFHGISAYAKRRASMCRRRWQAANDDDRFLVQIPKQH
jgi:hypothetical protein